MREDNEDEKNLNLNDSEDDLELKNIDLEYNRLKDLVDLPDPNKEEETPLLTKSEKKEKDNLMKILDNLNNTLKAEEKLSINKIYEELLNNEDITKRELKPNTNECLLQFMFYFIAPLFGIVFLVGIFQIITLKKALWELLKQSASKFYQCNFKHNCNITNYDPNNTYNINSDLMNDTIVTNTNETNVFDFYNYFYKSSLDETIDFNLMMITGFIGDLLLKSRGFRVSAFILSLFNFGVLFWLLNFDFNFKEPNVYDYDLVKVLTIFIIYILLLIGIGGSALLSQQILVDSHLKFKNYMIAKKREEWQRREEEERKKEEEEEEEEKEKKKEKEKERIELENYGDKGDEKERKEKSEKENSNEQNLVIENINEKEKEQLIVEDERAKSVKIERQQNRRKKKEKQLKNIEKNKFDFFFMICLTTAIAYFVKYLINLLLKYIMENIMTEYDKKYFYYFIIVLYDLSLFLSIFLYTIFVCIFTKNKKNKEEVNKYRICQICGYLIYSQKIILKKNPGKCKCFKLCCESTKNCCNEAVCSCFKNFDEDCECCCCCCCDYVEDDYDKNKEFFCYCYQAQRKSFWCNKFITNETQKKIFPYMAEYFLLQLTTIAFELQYEKYKGLHVHIKTYSSVFFLTFILFFYFTISLSRFIKVLDYDDDEINEDDDEKTKIRKAKNKELISKLSNEILDGTHGILLFNGVFSLLFSILYFSHMRSDYKTYIFEDNINIIFVPILMNKFYYFTLNFYCTSTSEDNKKFDFISSSTLISLYMAIWDIILFLIKLIISTFIENKLFNIFYIIQIIFDGIPSLIVAFFIVFGILRSSQCWEFICCDFDCYFFTLHKFLFCLLSFFLCFGGYWIKMDADCDLEYECCCRNYSCDCSDCCYFIGTTLYCDWCCCDTSCECCECCECFCCDCCSDYCCCCI